jgi:integrase
MLDERHLCPASFGGQTGGKAVDQQGGREMLTSKRIAKLLGQVGRYHDGHGLYLQVKTPNSASWLLRYQRDGREHWHGIGPLHVVTLAEARSRARAARLKLLDGIDPVEARKAAKATKALEAAKAVTFEQAARTHFDANRSKWRSPAHAAEYIGSLERHAFPVIGALPVASIDTGLVLKCVEPIWRDKTETASRVRQRIEAVLDYATVRNLRVGDNPARWGGHLEHTLPARNGTAIQHFEALPYAEMPAFMVELRHCVGIDARALEFAILTAARSSEVLKAFWPEIDLDAAVWTVPPEHMLKSRSSKPHRVPLSPQAIALLPDRTADGPVFARSDGRALGKHSLVRALERVRTGITVHGFRSTFRDWASERTAFPHEVCERALAHVTGSKSSRAYARSDLLDERRKLMEAWATFCNTPATIATDNVISSTSFDGRRGKR